MLKVLVKVHVYIILKPICPEPLDGCNCAQYPANGTLANSLDQDRYCRTSDQHLHCLHTETSVKTKINKNKKCLLKKDKRLRLNGIVFWNKCLR